MSQLQIQFVAIEKRIDKKESNDTCTRDSVCTGNDWAKETNDISDVMHTSECAMCEQLF